MSWVAQDPSAFVGQSVGSGQCVAYVQQAAGVPVTSQWVCGQQVKGAIIATGTAISTFDADGSYGNHVDGRSHAAIFHEEMPNGLLVWDQWFKHPVAPRLIAFDDGDGMWCDNGNRFYVIELAQNLSMTLSPGLQA